MQFIIEIAAIEKININICFSEYRKEFVNRPIFVMYTICFLLFIQYSLIKKAHSNYRNCIAKQKKRLFNIASSPTVSDYKIIQHMMNVLHDKYTTTTIRMFVSSPVSISSKRYPWSQIVIDVDKRQTTKQMWKGGQL